VGASEGDDDFTVLRVEVAGTKVGKATDRVGPLRPSGCERYTSMARTTGFRARSWCDWLRRAHGRAGVHPPETLGRDERVSTTILEELAKRGVSITRHEV
jgi:saccharopine dehydrogenase-like NADP-dependent oxidoreductase